MSFKFLGTKGQTYSTRGATYSADANGVVTVPAAANQDIEDLINDGLTPLGQLQALSNYGGTAAPAATNDSSQGYGIGSRWLDTTNKIEYVCTNPVVGSAVWIEKFSSAALASLEVLTSFAAVATTAVATGAVYGFTTAAQGNAVIALLNALRAGQISIGATGP